MASFTDPLTDAAAAIMREHPGMDPGRAWQLALQDDPSLYDHHTPDGSVGAGGRPAAAGGAVRDVVIAAVGERRHYSQLSAGERAEEHRKMGLGARMVPGATYVAKLAGDAAGGGFFEVIER